MNRKTRRKVKKALPIAIVGGLFFGLGSFAQASGGWIYNLTASSKSKIRIKTSQHTEELTTNIKTKVEDAVKKKLNDMADNQVQVVDNNVDDYFQKKVNNIANSPEFDNVKQDVTDYGNQMTQYQESKIDEAIKAAFGD